MSAAARWREALEAWAIPPTILDAAPESPYGFPAGMWSADPGPLDTPSHQRARELLPGNGSVLDVGCGGGAAAMGTVPPAGTLIGVDSAPHMLTAFEAAAPVPTRTVLGDWPQVAAQAGTADVVVCHHTTYNVPDLPPFVLALSAAARRRVVIEMTDVHPWVPTRELWRRFHDLDRPTGPDAALCEQVLHQYGIPVRVRHWRRPARRTDRADTVAFLRKRLCLPASADPEIDAAVPAGYEFSLRDVVTMWWDVRGPDQAG